MSAAIGATRLLTSWVAMAVFDHLRGMGNITYLVRSFFWVRGFVQIDMGHISTQRGGICSGGEGVYEISERIRRVVLCFEHRRIRI